MCGDHETDWKLLEFDKKLCYRDRCGRQWSPVFFAKAEIFEIPCHVRNKRAFFEPTPSLTELGVRLWMHAFRGSMKQPTEPPISKGFKDIV